MALDLTEPLIYTSKGNLPETSMTQVVEWDDTETYIACKHKYILDGEVVRESSHVYQKIGFIGGALMGNLGG